MVYKNRLNKLPPIVSVAMITYNHKNFITHALNSVLMQQTDFNFNIIIGDDASTDGTQEILQQFKKKYPEKINLYIHTENMGATKNFHYVLTHCTGQYIALLEGDDFWTDPLKLQKQVDFLEKNPQFIAYVHSHNEVDEFENVINSNPPDYLLNHSIYSFRDTAKTLFPSHTSTLLFRNIFANTPYDYQIIYQVHPISGDATLNILLAVQGDFYCTIEMMSSYRCICKSGGTNYRSIYQNKSIILDCLHRDILMDIYCYQNFNKHLDYSDRYYYYVWESFKNLIKYPSQENRRIFITVCKNSKKNLVLKHLFLCIIKTIRNKLTGKKYES